MLSKRIGRDVNAPTDHGGTDDEEEINIPHTRRLGSPRPRPEPERANDPDVGDVCLSLDGYVSR